MSKEKELIQGSYTCHKIKLNKSRAILAPRHKCFPLYSSAPVPFTLKWTIVSGSLSGWLSHLPIDRHNDLRLYHSEATNLCPASPQQHHSNNFTFLLLSYLLNQRPDLCVLFPFFSWAWCRTATFCNVKATE